MSMICDLICDNLFVIGWSMIYTGGLLITISATL